MLLANHIIIVCFIELTVSCYNKTSHPMTSIINTGIWWSPLAKCRLCTMLPIHKLCHKLNCVCLLTNTHTQANNIPNLAHIHNYTLNKIYYATKLVKICFIIKFRNKIKHVEWCKTECKINKVTPSQAGILPQHSAKWFSCRPSYVVSLPPQ